MSFTFNIWELLFVFVLAAALGGYLYDTYRYILIVTAAVIGAVFLAIFMVFKTAAIIMLGAVTILVLYIWYRRKRKAEFDDAEGGK